MTTLDHPIIPQLASLVGSMQMDVQPCGDEEHYRIQIDTTERQLAMALEVLRLLSSVSERLLRETKACASQERGSKRAALLHVQQEGIAQLYHEYRSRGYKHRDTIKIVLESELAQTLGCTSADVTYFAKAYPPASITDQTQGGQLQ